MSIPGNALSLRQYAPTNKGSKMAKAKPENQEPLEKQLWKAADKLRKNTDNESCYKRH
jgi:hypothetical protein